MTPAQTIIQAFQAASRGEPAPDIGTPASEALLEAVREIKSPGDLQETGRLLVQGLLEYTLTSMTAQRDVFKLKLSILKGEVPDARLDH